MSFSAFSETDPLLVVLTGRPVPSAIAYGSSHLDTSLYRESVDIVKLMDQYSSLVTILDALGVERIDISDRNQDVKKVEMREDVQEEVQGLLTEEMLANLQFVRDPVIATPKGIVLARFKEDVRRKETEIARIRFGDELIGEIEAPGIVEGGDFFPVGEKDVCLIGTGNRSNLEGVLQMMKKNLIGTTFVARVKHPFDGRGDLIHLDCYFGFASKKVVIVREKALNLPVDVYRSSNQEIVQSDVPFGTYLTSLGFDIIPTPDSCLSSYGCNTLVVDDHTVLVQDLFVVEKLKNYPEIRAVYIEYGEFHKMYGGIRCSTHGVLRRPLLQKSTFQSSDTVVMIEPIDFQFNEETAADNVFQNRVNLSQEEVKNLVTAEFNASYDLLSKAGVRIVRLGQAKKNKELGLQCPDAIFCNNWFSSHADGNLILYRMMSTNRSHESNIYPEMAAAFKSLGLDMNLDNPIDLRQADGIVESTGSVVFDRLNHIAYAAFSERTTVNFLRMLQHVGVIDYHRLIMFHTKSSHGLPFYHTNVMCALGTEWAVICLEAIANANENEADVVKKELYATRKHVVEITLSQAENFYCGNVFELRSHVEPNKHVIVLSETAKSGFTASQMQIFESCGEVVVFPIHTIELIGGGSARCMLGEVFYR